jgi:hypothetical protein
MLRQMLTPSGLKREGRRCFREVTRQDRSKRIDVQVVKIWGYISFGNGVRHGVSKGVEDGWASPKIVIRLFQGQPAHRA